MKEDIISIREIQKSDIPLLVNYWLGSDKAHLERMGVDVSKIPTEEELRNNLLKQIASPIEHKNAYCIIWLLDANPIGHCNTNPTEFGNEAFMHLHIWQTDIRSKGIGFTTHAPLLFCKLKPQKFILSALRFESGAKQNFAKTGI